MSVKKFPLKFFVLVFVLALPFWLLDAFAGDLTKALPINLPLSALTFVCPITAALILTYREQNSGGVKQLLGRVFDFKRTRQKIWYIPAILSMPVVMVLSYTVLHLRGVPLPEPHIPFLAIPIFFLAFFIGATGEEVGWSGYAIDPLQDRWGALQASLVLGSFWAIWHTVPFIQTHNTPTWIVWQCIGTVGVRVIITWLYNNTGKSVFVAILFHTMLNVSEFLFPNYGSHYDPVSTGILIIIAVVIVTFLWGAKTLACYKFGSEYHRTKTVL
ncbi:MAG: CPBP family intramembrane metalloprotease [Chloroflexota bacterium]|nr:CPBP family intramembrane metalloprotease [Chloroflexota bacterium]